jgi:hypothetical protein
MDKRMRAIAWSVMMMSLSLSAAPAFAARTPVAKPGGRAKRLGPIALRASMLGAGVAMVAGGFLTIRENPAAAGALVYGGGHLAIMSVSRLTPGNVVARLALTGVGAAAGGLLGHETAGDDNLGREAAAFLTANTSLILNGLGFLGSRQK